MKKVISLLLCLLVLCFACTAFAAEYQPGDTVTVTVSITSNSSGSADGSIMVKASDASVLQFVKGSGKLTMGGLSSSFPPQKDGASFALMSADMVSAIPTGTVGSVQYKIADNAQPGTYKINVSSKAFGVSGSVTVVIPEPACEHAYEAKVTTEPTCDKPGVKTLTCSKCGDVKTEEIAELGHAYDDGVVTTQPTCKAEGVKTFTCANCGHTYTEKIAKSDKHTWDDGVITKPGNCLVDGEKTFTCSVCGLKDVSVIKAPGQHTPGENTRVDKEPTCTENGAGSYQCSACGEWIDNGVIPATGHDKKETVTEATCGKAGQKVTTCSKCDFKETVEIPATGKHTYEEKVTTEPTCKAEGEKTFTCKVCGDSYTEKIAVKDHTPGADLKEEKPTCSKPGYKYYTCTVCGTEVKESEIPAVAHDYQVTEEIPATCEKAGKRVSTCSFGCGKTKTETLKKLGHKMGEYVITTEPTCTEKGVQTRTCENGCGKTETKSVQALGHDWAEWVITKPVTDKEAGERQRTCNRCGVVETQRISNLVDYHMTVCSKGIRFRDLENPITKEWTMFTPIDLSVEGEQTYDLIAGNMHVIGSVTVLVKEGTVTVTYKVNNPHTIFVFEEFMTILPALSAVTELDYEAMTNYAYGEPISIEETLGGDTQVLLLMRNRALYKEGAHGVKSFDANGAAYDAYVEELKLLMD